MPKPRRHPAHYPTHPPQNSNSIQPSDYESDVLPKQPSVPPKTNDQLNLSVLRRHNPAITAILSIGPYAVVYLFSTTTQQWEKTNVEGTLFVCQLTPAPDTGGGERYAVMVLNRRGLGNFTVELVEGEDVEVTEEYVILRGPSGADARAETAGVVAPVYGLWIFSEPAPSSTARTREVNARIIKDCAVGAETSRRLAMAAQKQVAFTNEKHTSGRSVRGADDDSGNRDAADGGVLMGRQLSLKELFGQQRATDDGWSVKNHSPRVPQGEWPSKGPFVPSVDTDFFRTGPRRSPQPPPPQPQQRQAEAQDNGGQGKDILGELFRKASQAMGNNPSGPR